MNNLPNTIGIGLKAPHYDELLANQPVEWLEIHPENYMGKGGLPHRYLTQIREQYSLSMHGVGMSLGSAEGVDERHLSRLKELVDRYQPQAVSEHLSWSHWNAIFFNDLLPLPYTEESLDVVCRNIDKVQSFLNRKILIENPSSYIDFAENEFSEPEFLSQIVRRSGCECLLDINNVFVSSFNNSFNPLTYLDDFPGDAVSEIHLAGHSLKTLEGNNHIRIDDHGSPVIDEVWSLYRYFIQYQMRKIPTLIEWDTDVPALDVLIIEASKADHCMDQVISSENDRIDETQ